MRKKASYFYALPADIKDALLASVGQYSEANLHRLALGKGVQLSSELSRKELCERISNLPFSYKEFCELSDSMLSSKKAPKTETTKLSSSISENDIEEGAEVLKSLPNHNVKITRNKGIVQVRAEYTEFDHKHTRLKQRVEREAVFEITRSGDGKLVISSPDTKHSREMVDLIINQVRAETQKDPEPERIDLSGYNPREVNKFFLAFTKSDSGLQYKKAIDVKLKKADGDDDEAELEKIESQTLADIQSASLSGDNVLSSTQVGDFLERGNYYIHSLRWETKPLEVMDVRPRSAKASSKAILIVEIKASPSDKRESFSYDVLTYKPEKVGSSGFCKEPQSITSEQKAAYKTKLGEKAYELYARLKSANEESVA